MQHNFSSILLFFTFWLLSQAVIGQTYQYETGVPVLQGQQVLQTPWAGGLNAVQASLADTDGDGQAELVLFDRSSTQVQVFAQTTEGWIWLPRERFRFPADLAYWLLLADYTGDGREDLFTYTPAGVRVFKNTATAGQPSNWELTYPLLEYPSSNRRINLLVNSGDVPLITDTDGDGDIDIAAFDPSGSGTIRWYKNVGVEKFGRADTLVFELADRHWGGVAECSCKEIALNYAACPDEGGRASQRPQHAGGKSLLWKDVSGDGVPDLLFGDEECSTLYYLPNTGTAASPQFNTVSSGLPGTSPAPDNIPFQAAYALGNNVLISTNLKNSGAWHSLQASLLLYEPLGVGNYALVQDDFLQDQQLDIGEEARPLFLDLDADGDQDLLLGGKALFRTDGQYASLQFYENTGTAAVPGFRLKETDFLGLSTARYGHLHPHLADLNKDGAPDLLITALDRTQNKVRTLVYLNKAGAGAPYRFEAPMSAELSLPLSTLDYPHFFDVSGDGLPDALVGRFDGSLRLYTNTGTASSPAFALSTSEYKGFTLDNVRRHLIPSVGDVNADGKPDLLVSDATGDVRVLYSFLEEGATATAAEGLEVEVEDASQAPRLGDKSWPVLVNLWAGEMPALAVGQIGGGIVLLRNTEALPPAGGEELLLSVFPNPSGNRPITIKTNVPAQIRIVNMLGQLVGSWHIHASQPYTWRPALPPGMYVVEARAAGQRSAGQRSAGQRKTFKLLLTP